MTCSCTVQNTGQIAGDEVVLVYDALSSAIRAAVGGAYPVPIQRLVNFERVPSLSHQCPDESPEP